MRVLIVYCHPNPKSFNHAIKDLASSELEKLGHDVRVRDLYALGFDPVLSGDDFSGIRRGKIPQDIAVEQQQISWADTIFLVYPIWWAGLPAVMKGYIDRVLSFGFAYTYEDGIPQGLLGGKNVFIVNTTGSPKEHYDALGMYDALKKTADSGIYEFCGFEVTGHLFFGAVPSVTDDVRKHYLDDLSLAIKDTFS